MPSAKFQEVYDKVASFKDSKDKKGDPSNDEQLDLYAWNKIARGEDFKAAPKPGMFDLKRKAMYNRWQKWNDEGLSKSDAEKKYIELGEQLINKYLK